MGTLTKTLSRTYDAFGELASETDALGNTTTYTKSNNGLTETVTFPDGGTRVTLRNAHGETLSATGTVITMTFDSQGRCPEYKSVSNFRKTRSCAFFSEINREAKIL